MLRNILLIVTYFIRSDSSIAVRCNTCALTFISQSRVKSREESVLEYINFTYYDASIDGKVRDKKAHSDLHIRLDIKQYTSLNLPFTRSWKSRDVEIVGAEI